MNETFSVYRKIENAPAVAIHCQVATKPHIVELMLDLAEYDGDRSKRLLDPGCGEGAFTLPAATRLVRSSRGKSFQELADCVVAIEKDPEVAAVCRSRLIDLLTAEGVGSPIAERLAERWVITGDFLDHKFSGQFDVVVVFGDN